ncbi:MAG: nucleoside hydrolase [Thermoguttaceae bacterium]|nr:nucleoside hydrolase [Thermoguttaceae bacterium]
MYKALIGLLAALVIFCGCFAARAESGKPVPVIFDTDIGSDVDDAFALAMLHTLMDRRECDLLAVTVTRSNRLAAELVQMLNAWYGHASIPVGLVENGVADDGGYYMDETLKAAEENGFTFEAAQIENAVTLLRRVLAAAEDGSVTIVQVVFTTNLSRLLDSPADDISPLSGTELAAKKVKVLQAMAGIFAGDYTHKEYNVVTDVPSAQKLFDRWPTPIQVSGYEIGAAVRLPSESVTDDYNYRPWHPLPIAFKALSVKLTGKLSDWATFDITSVMQGVRPDRYFTMSQPGTVTVEEDGTTRFTPDPAGRHRYFLLPDEAANARAQEAIINLCSQPPKGAER